MFLPNIIILVNSLESLNTFDIVIVYHSNHVVFGRSSTLPNSASVARSLTDYHTRSNKERPRLRTRRSLWARPPVPASRDKSRNNKDKRRTRPNNHSLRTTRPSSQKLRRPTATLSLNLAPTRPVRRRSKKTPARTKMKNNTTMKMSSTMTRTRTTTMTTRPTPTPSKAKRGSTSPKETRGRSNK